MPRGLLRSGRAAVAAVALLVSGATWLGGCATQGPAIGGRAATPEEISRALLGGNQGLVSLRAVAETGIRFAGREVSFPGVLVLDSLGGFRLDLLDPLDRLLAVVFAAEGRIVQYRPAAGQAASLAVFPSSCRGVDPGDWVRAVLASSPSPVPGDRLVDRGFWFGDRVLERFRGGALYQSVNYRPAGTRLRPTRVSWYCDGEPVLRLTLRDWLESSTWQLPSRFELEYPKMGLAVRIELKEIEGNPPPSRQPLRPVIGPGTGWSTWTLPR